jgi:uncharacterized protein YjbI with pentapeptide repeats
MHRLSGRWIVVLGASLLSIGVLWLLTIGKSLALHPLTIGIPITVGVVLICLFVLPARLVPSYSSEDLKKIASLAEKDRIELSNDRRKLQNDVRTALLQAVAGGAVLVGILFTWQQQQLTTRQVTDQLTVTRQGQVGERFSRAIDQLGSAKLDVRLGGIYELEQLAWQADDRRLVIYEVLSAYIRQHGSPSRGPTRQDLQARAPDVQAALTVLGRRKHSQEDPPLNLRHTSLEGAYLVGANLRGVKFGAADLRHADLSGADLYGAELERMRLDGADLSGASLGRVRLGGADLEGTVLTDAVLTEANLSGAVLRKANLGNARLDHAGLSRTDLRGASLSNSELRDANLWDSDLELADLEGADLRGANLGYTNFSRANLGDVRLERADLSGASLRDARLDGANLRDARMGGANVGGADLHGADLEGVDMHGVLADPHTTWPQSFDWKAAGIQQEASK